MSGLRGTERRAQRAFERAVLGHIVALCPPSGAARAESVEQAIGYYRHTAAGNPVQQVLGRRLRAAIAALEAEGLLDPAAGPDRYRPTAAGRDTIERVRQSWWRRALAATRVR
jgi:hypothetical protein